MQPDTLEEMPVSPAADRRLLAFRRIAAPLMSAVAGLPHSPDGPARSVADNARDFAALVDSTIELNHHVVTQFGLEAGDDASRWQTAGATADFVAAHYRATGQALDIADATSLIETLQGALPKLGDSITDPDVAAGKSQRPLARSLKALAPAASSIARFSFGRNALDLLAEVTHHLTTMAIEIAARLTGLEGATLLESPLYYAVLEIAGEFYLESHFAEMDRLLEMDPEERKAYVRSHNKKIPMEPVWEALELRLGMLEALVTYLPLPGAPAGGAA